MRKPGKMQRIPKEEVIFLAFKIPGWLEKNEATALYQFALKALAGKNPELNIIEIGSWLGRSTVVLGLACKKQGKGKVIAIDPHKDTFTHTTNHIASTKKQFIANLRKAQVATHVRPVFKTSQAAYASLRKIKSVLVWVDGSHEYQAVRQDVSWWGKTLVNGGFLLLHDTLNMVGPRQVMTELLLDKRYQYIRNYGEVACFCRTNTLSPRNWLKKLFSFGLMKLFFLIYAPAHN